MGDVRERFEAELEEAKILVAQEKWSAAELAILQLLLDHSGADYAWPHLLELRQDLQLAEFRINEPAIDLQSLTTGDLTSYDESKGEISIRYERETLRDFAQDGDWFLHPIQLGEDCSLSIEGEPKYVSGWGLMLEFEPRPPSGVGEGYVFTFSNEDSRLHGFDANGRALIEVKKSKSSRLASKPVKAEVRVTARYLIARCNGKTVFRVPNKGRRVGRFGLIASRNSRGARFGVLTVEGKVDPGWIRTLTDRHRDSRRKLFDDSWLAPEAFNAWRPLRPEADEIPTFLELVERTKVELAPSTSEQDRLYEFWATQLGQGRLAAIETATKLALLPEGALSSRAQAWLMARLWIELQYWRDARYLCEVMSASPAHGSDLRLLNAELLTRMGEQENACAEFKAVADRWPAELVGHVRHAEAQLMLGRPQEAYDACVRGLTCQPYRASLERLRRIANQAIQGPAASYWQVHQGQHFKLQTEEGGPQARIIGALLDDAWERCEGYFFPLIAHVEPIQASIDGVADATPSPHSLALLFSDRASLLRHAQWIPEGGAELTQGFYDRRLKQIVGWIPPEAADLRKELRQAVAARYLDLFSGPRLPRWLSDGLVHGFVHCWEEPYRFAPPGTNPAAVEILRANRDWPAIGPFMTQSDEEYLESMELGRAQGWLLLHLLGLGQKGTWVASLLGRIQQGETPMLVVDTAMDQLDIPALQRQFNRKVRPITKR